MLAAADRDGQRAGEIEEVERVGTTDCTDCMPYEDELPLWICRRLRMPVAELWPALKHFI